MTQRQAAQQTQRQAAQQTQRQAATRQHSVKRRGDTASSGDAGAQHQTAHKT